MAIGRTVKIHLVNLINPEYAKPQRDYPVRVLAEYLRIKGPKCSRVTIQDMQRRTFNILSRNGGIETADAAQIAANNIADDIIKKRPDIVGISARWGTYHSVISMIEKIRSQMPKQPQFVIGNTLSTFLADKLLSMDIFKDALMVRGEGEDALVAIVDRFFRNPERGHDLELYKGIPNVAYKGYLDGLRLPMKLDNNMYPEFSEGFIREFYGERFPMEMTRGCSWGACKFCSVDKLYASRSSAWRRFDLQRNMRMIEKYVAGSVKLAKHRNLVPSPTLYILDSEFLDPSKTETQLNIAFSRAEEFLNGMIEISGKYSELKDHPVKISHMPLRITDIYSKEDSPEMRERRISFLKLLNMANAEVNYIGVESGSSSQLIRFRKGFTPEDAVNALSIADKAGIDYEVGFIFWDHLVTIEELRENYLFIEKTKLYKKNSRIFGEHRPQYGSVLSEELIKKGLIDEERDLDLNTLSYTKSGINFRDEKVGKLFEQFQEWEGQTASLLRKMYSLSSLHPSLERFMLQLREMDFLFIGELIFNNDPSRKIHIYDERKAIIDEICELTKKHGLTDISKEVEKAQGGNSNFLTKP
jgi:radical SAM superfamily enzyme YgiQ (UPF0313 family)